MKLDPTSPEAWLLRARSNLRRAILGQQHPEVVLEDLVFDAQQAAEKALKAVCLHRGLAFPKTHSLVLLMDLVEATGIAIPPEVTILAEDSRGGTRDHPHGICSNLLHRSCPDRGIRDVGRLALATSDQPRA